MFHSCSIIWKSVPRITIFLRNYYFASIKWSLRFVYILRTEKWDFVNFCYKMNWELWGNDIINSLICILISSFVKICEVSNFHYFYLLFVQFSSNFHHSVCIVIFLLKSTRIWTGFSLEGANLHIKHYQGDSVLECPVQHTQFCKHFLVWWPQIKRNSVMFRFYTKYYGKVMYSNSQLEWFIIFLWNT